MLTVDQASTRLREPLCAAVRRISLDRSGGVAVLFAAMLPVLSVGALGAIQLGQVHADKANLQDVADAAALAGAGQLQLSDQTAAVQRAQAYADAQLQSFRQRGTASVSAATVDGGRGIQVTINANEPSFFGNLLPAGGFDLRATATAEAASAVPLCVLATSTARGFGTATIYASANSQVQAPACGIHSNGDIATRSVARVSALAVSASGAISGSIASNPQIGAPPIDDPFTNVNVSFNNTCTTAQSATVTFYTGGSATLAPGLHCGKFVVQLGATLTLLPGEHYFDSNLQVSDTSVLMGTDVVLLFDPRARFLFNQDARVDLTGRRTGPLAGFVIASSRQNVNIFNINANYVQRLEGTVYIPSATLSVGSNNPVAQQSAWTVIVANSLSTNSYTSLVMNANYSSSPVPVPAGVGPTQSTPRLIN